MVSPTLGRTPSGDTSPGSRLQGVDRVEGRVDSSSGNRGGESNRPDSHRAGDSRSRVTSGGGMYSGIKQILLGWLPGRAAPKDLVRRGILHADPSASKANANTIFGNELRVVLLRADTEQGVPRVVRALMGRLRASDYEGLRTEGIFRVPGDSSEMRGMREHINQGEDLDAVIARCDDVHSVAGLLKMFFRELPSPLLTFELYDAFIRCSARLGGSSTDSDLTELHGLLRRLPEGHDDLLQALVLFLAEVPRFTSESKMNVGNTAAVFAPNLLRPELESLEHLADTVHIVNLVGLMISQPERIFPAVAASLDRQTSGSGSASRAAGRHISVRSTSASEAEGSGRYRLSFASSGSSGADSSHAKSTGAAESQQPVVAPTANRWFFLDVNMKQQGPVGWASVQALFQESQRTGVTQVTHVFAEGMSAWTSTAEIDLTGPEPNSGPGPVDVA